MIALCFFLAPVLPPFGVVAVFLVTLVDVLANEDVDLAEGVVAFGLAGAAAGDEVGAVAGVAVAAAGFLVASTFYSSFGNAMK